MGFFPSRTGRAKAVAEKGQAGYDNPRENIDPFIKTQAISTKEILSGAKVVGDFEITGKLSGGNILGDNLGNHTATQTISGADMFLSGILSGQGIKTGSISGVYLYITRGAGDSRILLKSTGSNAIVEVDCGTNQASGTKYLMNGAQTWNYGVQAVSNDFQLSDNSGVVFEIEQISNNLLVKQMISGAGFMSSGSISGAKIISSGLISGVGFMTSGSISGANIISSGTISGANILSSGTISGTMLYLSGGTLGSRILTVDAWIPSIALRRAGSEITTFAVANAANDWFTGTAPNEAALRTGLEDLWIGSVLGEKDIHFVTNDSEKLIITSSGLVSGTAMFSGNGATGSFSTLSGQFITVSGGIILSIA